jgi:hypothetical protein
VYAVSGQQMRARGVAELDAMGRPIQEVSVYPHAGSDGMQYHVVLWHVPRAQATQSR